jgi:hypothetical protein
MRHSPSLALARFVLGALIALNWIAGAGILALLAASFMAEAWTWQALGVGTAAGHGSVISAMRGIMIAGILGVPLAYLVLSRLRRIVDTARIREALSAENAGRLRLIALAMLALELLHIGVVAIASQVTAAGIPLNVSRDFSVTGWLAILMLFVLAQVFLDGSRLREDLEGTV